MAEDNVAGLRRPAAEGVEDPLTELVRSGARKLIEQALEVVLAELLSQHAGRRDEHGRAAVVRNGYLPERAVLTGVRLVSVRVPQVRSRTGASVVFRSSLVPPYVRRAKCLDVALPWLNFKGISTGQMAEALRELVGSEAKGLSASVVGKLKRQWGREYEASRSRRLDTRRSVYWWADGIYSGLRGDGQRLCALVIVGVDDRGAKHLVAIEVGLRELKKSRREVLLQLKVQGRERPPKLAVGDGALGFWAALEEVYPSVRHQRCWVHKTANVLNYLPRSVQPKTEAALQAIWMAETREQAEKGFDRFIATCGAKYPKATECLSKDRDALLALYDSSAEHWVHVRTTNPVESTFATLRNHSDRAKGCVIRNSMLALVFKLGLAAEQRWGRIRCFEQLAKIIEGVKFNGGIEIESSDRVAA